jgi:hypothetical protein
MVGQVVAAKVAPTIVNSSKKEDGLVNQLFKIAILIGGLIFISVAIGLIIFFLSFDIGGFFSGIFSPIISVFDATWSVFTGVASGFGFGRKGGFNYKNTGNQATSYIQRYLKDR